MQFTISLPHFERSNRGRVVTIPGIHQAVGYLATLIIALNRIQRGHRPRTFSSNTFKFTYLDYNIMFLYLELYIIP